MKKFIFRENLGPEGKRKFPFTAISKSIIDDSRLTLELKGLMLVLLSNKDDFNQSIPALARKLKMGEKTLAQKVTQLEVLGYVQRRKFRDSKGLFVWEVIVNEIPSHPNGPNPSVANPNDGNPKGGNTPPLISNNINQEEVIKNNLPKELLIKEERLLLVEPVVEFIPMDEDENDNFSEPFDENSIEYQNWLKSLNPPDWSNSGNIEDIVSSEEG